MSGRETDMLDVREILRQLHAGESLRQVAEQVGVSRLTVSKYQAWAAARGLLDGPLPTPEELTRLVEQDRLTRPPVLPTSSVEPYRALVIDLRQRGVEMMTIFHRLRDEHGYTGAYASVRRFVHALEPSQPEVTIRIERAPGEEAQVDFGYAGLMLDAHGQLHRAWAFVMTLSYSRHQYTEFVFEQTVATWLQLHQHAFESFGGVPRKVVLDNLKAGIVKACFDDPQVQRAYRDCAEHYGFLIAPCRVREPQEKGKVESGVHYVQRSFLAGREPAALMANNAAVWQWVEHTAGMRDHGTTHWQPLVQFQHVERAALLPLPATPFELATWKQAKVHRDCYVQFDKAYYSAPFRYVGQTLWVRGTAGRIEVYAEHALIATHPRAATPGHRETNLAHLPMLKADALTLTAERCREQAAAIGPTTQQVVELLLAERPLDRLRTVRKVLRLAETHTPLRLERACARALRFDTATYRSLKQILQQGLDAAELESEAVVAMPSESPLFARPTHELLGVGGA